MRAIGTAGHVDHGKSTLIGRLLYDSKAIFDDQLDAIERAHVLYKTEGLGARNDATQMQFLIPNWTFDPKCPSMVR